MDPTKMKRAYGLHTKKKEKYIERELLITYKPYLVTLEICKLVNGGE